MGYIKKINEYEDSEIMDLMGDLLGLGFEDHFGWYFSWDSSTENPLAEIIISNDPRKVFEIYKSHGWFGEDIKYAEKKGLKFKNLEDVFVYLLKNSFITSYSIVWDLSVGGANKNDEYIRMGNQNPFALTKILESKFTNSEERFRKSYPSHPSVLPL